VQLATQPVGAHNGVPPEHASNADVHVEGLERSVSHPFAGLPSVSAQPGSQLATLQAPPSPPHAPMACAGEHATQDPHPNAGSETDTQTPLQRVSPPAQGVDVHTSVEAEASVPAS
jgi:hypothetical protein